MKKRLAALLLTLAMVVTYMPTMALTSFAWGEEGYLSIDDNYVVATSLHTKTDAYYFLKNGDKNITAPVLISAGASVQLKACSELSENTQYDLYESSSSEGKNAVKVNDIKFYKYSLIYKANNGTDTSITTDKYADVNDERCNFIVNENTFENPGYVFSTWNDGGKNYQPGSSYTINKSKQSSNRTATLNAKWNKFYTITKSATNANISLDPDATSVQAGTKVKITATSTKQGLARKVYRAYKTGDTSTNVTIEHHYRQQGDWNEYDYIVMPGYDVTIEVVYAVDKYTVTFRGNGGKYNSKDSYTQDFKYEDEYSGNLIENKFAKTGYTFAKWKEFKGTEEYENKAEITLSANKDLVAQWTANQYDVTFKGNYEGSEYSETVTETYDSNYELPETDPTRTGYTFAGWYTDDEGGKRVTTSDIVKITSNTTLYAHWTKNEYTVTDNNPENGSIDYYGPSKKHYKDVISFKVTSDKGYRVSKVQAETETGEFVTVEYVGLGVYKFEMPAENVELNVEFEKKTSFVANPSDKSDENFLKSEAKRIFDEMMIDGTAEGTNFTAEDIEKIKAAYENPDITDVDVELNVNIDKAKTVSDAVIKSIKKGERQCANYDVNVEMKVSTIKRDRSGAETKTFTADVSELSNAVKLGLNTGASLNGNVRVLHDHEGEITEAKISGLDKSKGNVTVSISKFSTLTVVDEMPVGAATGDNNNIYLYMMLAIAAVVAAGYVVSRKEN